MHFLLFKQKKYVILVAVLILPYYGFSYKRRTLMIVMIPAYEPDEKLLGVVRDFRENAPDFPIVIVDDGSSAPCQKIFEALEGQAGITVLHHPHNKGKGAAMKTAFSYISERYPASEGILTVDADGQHLLKDSLEVCRVWRENPDYLVTGSRRFAGKVPLRSRLGNAITRGMFHLTTGKRVYDTQTGLRAFSVGRVPEMLALAGDRYEYEINQLLYCCMNGVGVYEVPIETVYIDDNASSHFNVLRDSIKIYKVIFKYLGPTFLKFLSSSFLSFLIDLLGFCLFFYGAVAIFANWDTARAMFSFTREPSSEWRAVLEAFNPVVFAAGGTYLRIGSLVLARIISAVANYLMNRSFVFRAKNGGSSFWKYFLVSVLILALNALFLELFTRLGVPAWLSNMFAQIICYPLSYYLQRAFVFQNGKELKQNG